MMISWLISVCVCMFVCVNLKFPYYIHCAIKYVYNYVVVINIYLITSELSNLLNN